MSRARAYVVSMRRVLQRAGKLPLSIAALWIFACGIHAALAHALANQAHAAAMLTQPSDSTLLLGASLVAVRLVVFLVLPAALAWVIAWRSGNRLARWLLSPSRSEKRVPPDRAVQRSSQYE